MGWREDVKRRYSAGEATFRTGGDAFELRLRRFSRSGKPLMERPGRSTVLSLGTTMREAVIVKALICFVMLQAPLTNGNQQEAAELGLCDCEHLSDSPLSITFERLGPDTTSRNPRDKVVWLRLSNNANCTLLKITGNQ
jgi:hypothetical protein